MILNPTPSQKSEWYKCGGRVARYLITLGNIFIHYEKNDYYFIKNQKLLDSIKNIPFWIKLLDVFNY